MKEKTFLAVIPARGGSKSIKFKNICDLNGNPLMTYTIDAAKKSTLLTRAIVSTEDALIKDVAQKANIEVVDRPAELAGDNVNATAPVIHAIQYLEERDHFKTDYVVLLQPNFPFRKPEQIDKAIEMMLANADHADSVISVIKQDHPPWWLKRIDENGLLKDFLVYDKSKQTERQHFPETFALCGCIYIAKADVLIKKGLFNLMESSIPYIMDTISSFEIEKQEDISLANFYMKEKNL